MIIMILGVILLVAGIGFVVFRNIMAQIAQGSAPQPPVVVTAMKADKQEWQPQLNAVGSLRALRGVDVTTEIAGLVREPVEVLDAAPLEAAHQGEQQCGRRRVGLTAAARADRRPR